MADFVTLDLETTLRDEQDSFKATPHSKDNFAVCYGMLFSGGKDTEYRDGYNNTTGVSIYPPVVLTNVVLIGQNIVFDILYLLLRNTEVQARTAWLRWLRSPGAKIWDTSIAEYKLSGHDSKFPSLNDMAEAEGLPLKPDRIKEYWDAGIDTTDIPKDELLEYQEHDVRTTWEVFKRQVKRMKELGMARQFKVEMRARLASIEAEYNGMASDQVWSENYLHETALPVLSEAKTKAEEAIYLSMGVSTAERVQPPRDAINLGSPAFLKHWLYGDLYQWDERVAVLGEDGEPYRYKTGNRVGEIKTKKVKVDGRYLGILDKSHYPKEQTTEAEVLQSIVANKQVPETVRDAISAVLTTKTLSKLVSSFIVGYGDLRRSETGCIHPTINHTKTVTGRLSSSSPNLQQAPHHEIRRAFVSRWEGGNLVEIDLSQIEVVVLAYLSQSKQMIQDVKDGVDFHSLRASVVYKTDYEPVLRAVQDTNDSEHMLWKQRRKDSKAISFKRQYGAGIASVVHATGLSFSEVQEFYTAEEKLYPEVAQLHERWEKEVTRTGRYVSPTGSQYQFTREAGRKGELSYKPTKIKNYMVQGLAADIMKMLLPVIRTYVRKHYGEDVLLINLVHDSYLFDAKPSVDAREFSKRVVGIIEKTPEIFERVYGVPFNVPVKADAEAGPNWFDMEEV